MNELLGSASPTMGTFWYLNYNITPWYSFIISLGFVSTGFNSKSRTEFAYIVHVIFRTNFMKCLCLLLVLVLNASYI